MATKIYRVKSKGVKMIIRRRGSDYADSEFDLWGGEGGRSPRTRGSFLSYAFYGRIQFYRVYDKRRSLIYIFTGKNVENIYSRANYNTFLQRAMNICIPLFF